MSDKNKKEILKFSVLHNIQKSQEKIKKLDEQILEASIIIEEYEAKYGTKDCRLDLRLDRNKGYIEDRRNQLVNYKDRLAKLEVLKEERQRSLIALTQIRQT